MSARHTQHTHFEQMDYVFLRSFHLTFTRSRIIRNVDVEYLQFFFIGVVFSFQVDHSILPGFGSLTWDTTVFKIFIKMSLSVFFINFEESTNPHKKHIRIKWHTMNLSSRYSFIFSCYHGHQAKKKITKRRNFSSFQANASDIFLTWKDSIYKAMK